MSTWFCFHKKSQFSYSLMKWYNIICLLKGLRDLIIYLFGVCVFCVFCLFLCFGLALIFWGKAHFLGLLWTEWFLQQMGSSQQMNDMTTGTLQCWEYQNTPLLLGGLCGAMNWIQELNLEWFKLCIYILTTPMLTFKKSK